MASRLTEIAQVDALLEIKMAKLNSLSRVRGFILVEKSLSIFSHVGRSERWRMGLTLNLWMQRRSGGGVWSSDVNWSDIG
jgi:hypothetical protein